MFINPSIQLYLEASNTRVPIDLISHTSNIKEIDFAGTFDAKLNVGEEDIPLELYIAASSNVITTLSSIDFDIGVDIDLFPLHSTLVDLLKKLKRIGYPTGADFNKDLVPFLPPLDYSCVSKSGIEYLQRKTPQGNSPLSGFLGAIADDCSSNSFALSGGYNSTSEELIQV